MLNNVAHLDGMHACLLVGTYVCTFACMFMYIRTFKNIISLWSHWNDSITTLRTYLCMYVYLCIVVLLFRGRG